MPIARGYVSRHSRGLSPDEEVRGLKRLWEQQQAAEERKVAEARRLEKLRREEASQPVFDELAAGIPALATEQGWVGLAERAESLVESGFLSDRQGEELHARLVRLALQLGWLTPADARAYAGPALVADVERLVDQYLEGGR